jgi:hypothetical protein
MQVGERITVIDVYQPDVFVVASFQLFSLCP